jgi:5-methylcytosine-specific restriction endonuclease McrA
VTGVLKAKKKHSVKVRDGGRCVYCGSFYDLTIDHVVPRSKGGTDDRSNLQTLCRPCNEKKADSA